MVIEKFVKEKNNKYKVYIDNEIYELYDDVILKYNLLFKKEIDNDLLDKIILENNELMSYYDALKYINKKMRSCKEINDYLIKKDYNIKIINKTIEKLKYNLALNDELYAKCYINDQLNLTNKGKNKIINELKLKEIDEDIIYNNIDKIDDKIWNERISNYIEKKIKLNHNNGWNLLKIKIINELIRLGYEKENIDIIINKYKINDEEKKKNEYEKIKKRLEKKYSGYELEMKIKQNMYRKGFDYYD